MQKFIKSFIWAAKGLKSVWVEEFNFRIEILIGTLAVIAAFMRDFSPGQWVFLVLTIALVLMGEIVNTVIEDICNKIQPEHDAVIGRIKDMMAGYVLVSSVAAVIVGLFLFLA
ncbi:MAG: diacylglycerol kinase family protein [Candidatus Paceibacterota bacterium]|jgi:diacylglycerol kinase